MASSLPGPSVIAMNSLCLQPALGFPCLQPLSMRALGVGSSEVQIPNCLLSGWTVRARPHPHLFIFCLGSFPVLSVALGWEVQWGWVAVGVLGAQQQESGLQKAFQS